MRERYCALIIGILFVVLGIAGFVPSFMTMPVGAPDVVVDAPNLTFDAGYGHLFGLFPTNFVHNAVHLIVGLLGIVSSIDSSRARQFNRVFAIAYALIAIMGLLPYTNTTFGLMPIFGHNVWLNALTALVAGYFGFVMPTMATATDMDAARTS